MPGLDIHLGIWLAMEQAGLYPTDLAGTSAGAIVSAVQASGLRADALRATLLSLSDSDVRSEVRFWKLRVPWLTHFLRNEPILRLLDELCAPSFADQDLPFSAWATRLATGESVNVARPEIAARPALAALASMSICGVFPAVNLDDGYSYIDGGVRRNLPLPANWQDYDEVWLLIASGAPRDYQARPGILTNLLRNVHVLMLDQTEDVLEQTANCPQVRVVWPTVRVPRGALHFDHALIGEAYVQTAQMLAAGRLTTKAGKTHGC